MKHHLSTPASSCSANQLWLVFNKTRQDKTTLFNQGSPISCKAGILRGPGFNKTYIYTFTIKLQGEVKLAKITGGEKKIR